MLQRENYSDRKTIRYRQMRRRSTRGTDFHALSVQWLSAVRPTVKESTYTRYYRHVYAYLLPHFTGKSLASLPRSLTQTLLTAGGVNGSPLSPKTVTDILSVLRAILHFGCVNGFACPPPEAIVYPKRQKKKVSILPEETRRRIETYLWNADESVAFGILLTLYTGLRIGELCGLRWEDVDLNNNTIEVRRTVERIADLSGSEQKTKVVIAPPKTDNARRIIPLPVALAEHLRHHTGAGAHYLLTDTDKPTEPRVFYRRYQAFLRRIGVAEHYTFHALRHTFATRCVECGFDTKSLSEILGHANVNTTLSLYVHPTLEQKRRQMERLLSST